MKPSTIPIILKITSGRISPLLVGILTIIILLLTLTAAFQLENVRLIPSNYSGSIYMILTTGYVLFITRVIYNSHLKGIEKLLTSSGLSDEQKGNYLDQMHNFPPLIGETITALTVGFLHAYLASLRFLFDGTAKLPLLNVWTGVGIMLLWLVITYSTALSIRNMRLLNKISREIEIDLLNMEKFMPLTKSGVISILGFIGAYSLLFIQNVRIVDLTTSSILPLITNPAMIPLIPCIIWMLVTPLKGLRKRVIEAKENEIALIDRAIEGDRGVLKESRIGANLDNINVIDLINYKKIILNTLEIPINLPTASRFVFYLIIPLLTWVASSIVDKSLDMFF